MAQMSAELRGDGWTPHLPQHAEYVKTHGWVNIRTPPKSAKSRAAVQPLRTKFTGFTTFSRSIESLKPYLEYFQSFDVEFLELVGSGGGGLAALFKLKGADGKMKKVVAKISYPHSRDHFGTEIRFHEVGRVRSGSVKCPSP